ncbi:Phage Tail Collar Domain [Pragia fontium DSM 5563 = ATCC 49100]|uniref:Phage Tail Collar Domain n=1 Tax=Pragia fontium DSM 5563 = ATCC 49100 TaxID=1122977 RepID=A0AAJ4W7E6_9GAMM|nr:phage tail protein [Pragia fontium]SFB96973.1 Phage Tail Collar Domain [Pragia fontium DSM 5563 = ATCC 49100]
MTTFAENHIVFPDGQLNVAPLPEAVMHNGFTPETRDAPGMPLPAQYLNWLFRDIYRRSQALEEKSQTLNSRVIPAWMPIACPMEQPPLGYLKCNGAKFDKEKYPELAMGYPSGALPDLRGEFIRGWDDGRGVDVGRTLLSSQVDAIRNITGGLIRTLRSGSAVSPSGVFRGVLDNTISGVGSAGVELSTVSFDASRVVPTANENRPRNVAFLYIVRAA